MRNPVKHIRGFMSAFGTHRQVEKKLWLLYEAAINSNIADDWSKDKRAEVYFFVKTLTKFFKGFTALYEVTEETIRQKADIEN